MLVPELIEISQKFCASVAALMPADPPLLTNVRECVGEFRDIFDKSPDGGNQNGIYWFSRKSGDVVYIGKAQDTALFVRVCWHMRAPVRKNGEPIFQNCRFLDLGILESDEGLEQEFRLGHINIGWMTIEKYYYSALFEVFLHTYCSAGGGKLPLLCRRIG